MVLLGGNCINLNTSQDSSFYQTKYLLIGSEYPITLQGNFRTEYFRSKRYRINASAGVPLPWKEIILIKRDHILPRAYIQSYTCYIYPDTENQNVLKIFGHGCLLGMMINTDEAHLRCDIPVMTMIDIYRSSQVLTDVTFLLAGSELIFGFHSGCNVTEPYKMMIVIKQTPSLSILDFDLTPA